MERIQRTGRRDIKYYRKIFFKVLGVIFLLASFLIIFRKAGYIINVSNSLPYGIYKIVEKFPKEEKIADHIFSYPKYPKLKRGDYVLLNIPKGYEKFFYERGYISKDGIVKHLIKQVEGIEGDTFEVVEKENIGLVLKRNDKEIGIVSRVDSLGRELPYIKKLKIKFNEYFLMGTSLKSLDSRYYGAVHSRDIVAQIKP
ncbi:MAG: S26 family signal peptidase, partial [Fusobacterium sp.]|nr:S26 family signal peptidase [Fusobacterium sp.]